MCESRRFFEARVGRVGRVSTGVDAMFFIIANFSLWIGMPASISSSSSKPPKHQKRGKERREL
tara:strand:+ start:120 stop:308 length:189 start_codon:yes stop_codon:yes gene_type:complete